MNHGGLFSLAGFRLVYYRALRTQRKPRLDKPEEGVVFILADTL